MLRSGLLWNITHAFYTSYGLWKLLKPSISVFLTFIKGNITDLLRFGWELSTLKHSKHLEQCLSNNKYSINVSREYYHYHFSIEILVYTMKLMVSFKGKMYVLSNWSFLFWFLLIKIYFLNFSHSPIMFVVFVHISYT